MTYKTLLFLLTAILIITSPVLSGDVIPSKGSLRTQDNIGISYDHYRQGFKSVIIVCPGFFNSKDNRWMHKAVELLLSEYDVIAFDFRGHGQSGGLYTWSAKERLDLDTVVDYAKSLGYEHIGIVAFSLGAAVAANEAAFRDDIDSMVLISCPSRFQDIDFCFWEPGMFSDLKDNIDCKWEGKGARFANLFMSKESPIDSVRHIKHTPIFFIQGDSDWIIKERHAKKLYDATSAKKRLEVIKGGFHAERLLQFYYDEISKMILDWFSETLNSSNVL